MSKLDVGSWPDKVTRRAFLLYSFAIIASGQRHDKNYPRRKVTRDRPAELRGSRQQRFEQNIKAESFGIGQISTDSELLAMAGDGRLVELKSGNDYHVDRGVLPARKFRRGKKTIICLPKENKVFVRTYAMPYVGLLARDFFIEFKKKKKLKITSGARSLEEQILMRTKGSCYYNSNAAMASDPLEESLHVRAMAIDVSRRVVTVVKDKLREMPMSRKETKWMRDRLIADKLNGVEFEEEDQEEPVMLKTYPIEERICFHIVIFPR